MLMPSWFKELQTRCWFYLCGKSQLTIVTKLVQVLQLQVSKLRGDANPVPMGVVGAGEVPHHHNSEHVAHWGQQELVEPKLAAGQGYQTHFFPRFGVAVGSFQVGHAGHRTNGDQLPFDVNHCCKQKSK